MAQFRKLAAILVADIVGYSRLTGLDEEETLARIRALNADIIDPLIAANNGRLVKRTGDGVLVEFRSVVDAVRAAMEIQARMPERNAALPEDRQINLRMGIHLGDVIEEADGDLMGDGVNIAARLEGLAEPGAICLSEDAYRQVRARLKLRVSDLGETRLKNIAEPLRVFSVTPAAAGDPDGTTSDAASPPDKASIAVLPFTNMSGDPEQEYFVDGMVEDILTALSRFDELVVVARNSTFIYKGRAVDVKSVGKDLGVRYVLEGSVRKAGERVRITGQLIDTLTGAHLWADRFDGQLTDVFELQDEVTAAVVGALEPTMRKAEIERARRKPVGNLGAYDLYLQALPHIYAIRADENRTALELLERAIARDPGYAPALAHAGWSLVQRITRHWPAYGPDDRAQAVTWARAALATGSEDAKAVLLGGFVLVMLGANYETGLAALDRAVAMNPGSGFINAMAGCGSIFAGRTDFGLHLLDRAFRLCPKDPNLPVYLAVAGAGHLFNGNPEKTVELLERARALEDRLDSIFWVLATAYVELGQTEAAQGAVRQLMAANPDAGAATYERALPIRDPQDRARVIDSLRAAGLPD